MADPQTVVILAVTSGPVCRSLVVLVLGRVVLGSVSCECEIFTTAAAMSCGRWAVRG